MKMPRSLMLLMVLWGATAVVAAEEQAAGSAAAVDTSKWQCKFCTFEEGRSTELEVGVGSVSEDSFKFGEYTGLHEEGTYLVGGAWVRYRGEDAAYYDLEANDLGLDSRFIGLQGGKQGEYDLFLEYNQLPHFISDSARTPFVGSGSDTLTLPPGWVRAGTTGGMTALAASLRALDIETERKSLGLGVRFFPAPKWQSSVKARHEIKEGTQRIAGAVQFVSAQLAQPVDYVTDEIDASATYSGGRLQARFGYYGSVFRNRDESLTWEIPFLVVPTAGQLALPPDNQFHQLLASLGYQLNKKTRLSADLAVGRGEQDEDFLPASTAIAVALPRTSLDGRVDTLTANLGINSALTERWQLNAAYRYNDRDNETPQATYTWVSTDVFISPTPRTNLPYSFTLRTVEVSADYRTAPHTKVSFGVDREIHERTFQEVEETRENTIWLKLIERPKDNVDLLFKVARADREVSNYDPVAEIVPAQNPLLRKFNMADRERDIVGLQATVTASDRVSFGAGLALANSDYTDSTIGLLESRELNVNADTSVMLSEKTSVHFFIDHQRIKSEQAGSQAYPAPPPVIPTPADWFADEDDTINTAGIGVKHVLMENKLDVGADYTVSQSRGEITVTPAVPGPPFPDLKTKLNSLKLFATYRLKEKLSLNAAYWKESYDTSDWQLDGVMPSTTPSVLTFGETSPEYDVNVVSVSVRYKF